MLSLFPAITRDSRVVLSKFKERDFAASKERSNRTSSAQEGTGSDRRAAGNEAFPLPSCPRGDAQVAELCLPSPPGAKG